MQSLGKKSGVWFLSPRIPCSWPLWGCGSDRPVLPLVQRGRGGPSWGRAVSHPGVGPRFLGAALPSVHAHAHTRTHTPCLPVGSVGVQVGEEASAGWPEAQASRAETVFLCSHRCPHSEENPGLCHTYCWAYFWRTEVGAVSRRVPWEEGDWRESKRRQVKTPSDSSSTPCITARPYIKPVYSLHVGMERKTASLPQVAGWGLWTRGMSPPLLDEVRQGMDRFCCEKGRQDWLWPLAHLLTGPLATCWVGSGLARVVGIEQVLAAPSPGLPSALPAPESGRRWARASTGPHTGCLRAGTPARHRKSLVLTAVRWPLWAPLYRGGN